MKTRKVKCKICDKEFIATIELVGRPSRTSNLCMGSSSVYRMLTSDDGICFKPGGANTGYWFCNECWSMIIK